VRIQGDEERLVANRFADAIHIVERLSVQLQADAAHPSGVPFLRRHLQTVRTKPRDIFLAAAIHLALSLAWIDGAVLEEFAAMKVGMAPARLDELAREAEQSLGILIKVPPIPTGWVVLRIGVVVARLRPADFVAAADHWNALREQ